MNREEFFRGEIDFTGGLFGTVIKKYPETKEFISKEISKRMKRNKKIEAKLSDPKDRIKNVVSEVIRQLSGKGDDR